MNVRIPRVVIAGLSGDSGKTIVSLSLVAALRRRGKAVSVFKKGPDYIDAAWLSHLSGTACRNLDTYLVDPTTASRTFARHAAGSDMAVIEGNRGLYDGKDVSGTHSTAELAKLLRAPVVLVVNTAKTTRTIAALVHGCVLFDPEVRAAGVILNKVAGQRHGAIIRNAIEQYTPLPVLGEIPNLREESRLIPGRHLGLVPPAEFEAGSAVEDRLCRLAEENLDVDGLITIASGAPDFDVNVGMAATAVPAEVKVGYFRDSVFTFYYPENLEALEAAGAALVPVDSLRDDTLPAIDALYIGGGFPETQAARLAQNRSLLEAVRREAESGLPIYAECGGLILLSRSLLMGESRYTMAGVLPVDLEMNDRPVGHGYARLHVDQPNPFFEVGTSIKGHEFHYAGVAGETAGIASCMKVDTGVGVGGGRDGFVYRQTVAAFTHIHADGHPKWARSVVARAREYRSASRSENPDGNNCCQDGEATLNNTASDSESKAIAYM